MISALVAAVTFLPLLFSQPCQTQISRLFRYLGSITFPNRARCESITWDAVHDGPLHSCQSIYRSHCTPGHHRRKECWRFITDLLSTKAMKNQGACKYVEKPEALGLFGGTYLCIDVRILVALMLCTVYKSKSHSWREGTTCYDDDFTLSLRSVGPDRDLLVAHLRGQLKQERVRLTKAELTALMVGYPPWYRERVVCAHSPSIPFPIRSDADIARGGWIIAVGLTELETRQPTALYIVPNLNDQQPDGSYYKRTNGSHLRLAVERVYDVLKILRESIDDPRLEAVIKAVSYMIERGTGSGARRFFPDGSVAGGSISQLNAKQCTFAMMLFNEMVPTDEDVQYLRPILAPVLHAAFEGCYEVIQYLKDAGMRLVLPQCIGNDWSRQIYLRDCVVDEA